MVGNDVIDLADPQCLPMGTHPRFDQRVFAPSELQVLHAGTTPAWTRWMLWAAKESAYKLLRKRDAAVTFTPRHFVVEPHDSAGGTDHAADCTPWSGDQVHGTVTGAGYRVAFRGVVTGEALHVIATDAAHGSAELLTAVVDAALAEPGVAVRRVAAAAVADRLGVPSDALRIVRQGRIPRLQLHGMPLPIDLSLSHHGRFVGFAALVPCHGGGM